MLGEPLFCSGVGLGLLMPWDQFPLNGGGFFYCPNCIFDRNKPKQTQFRTVGLEMGQAVYYIVSCIFVLIGEQVGYRAS